ncbi:MAG: hypothetical protein ACE5H7_09735 [Acidiferrobacterales bacterium]
MRVGTFLMSGLILVLSSGCASYVATSGRVVFTDEKATIDVTFSNRDRQVIYDYYGGRKGQKKKKAPPGLAKQGDDLPPGLAKRDTLPPGLQGRVLPADLEAQLTPLPRSYVRVTIGADVVLLNRDTRVVLDVIYGVAS